MSVSLCPSFGVGWQGFTSGGIPLNAGLINTYIAGGTTPQSTFTTSAGNVANGNPIVLGPDGRPPSEIWLTDGVFYRFDLTDSLSNLIKTYDNIGSLGANATTGSGAVVLANTPTLITPVIGAATGTSLVLSGGLTATGGTLTSGTIAGTEIVSGTMSGGTYTGSTFTNPANTTQALTDQATITWDASLGAVATVTLGGNRTMAAPTNLKAGGVYFLRVTQDGTGNRTLAFNAVFKSNGGSISNPALIAASVTIYTFGSDGTNLYLIAPVYSEGPWTLSLGGTATYTVQAGTFTKTGRLAFVQGALAVNLIGTGSTTVISGLPFTCGSQSTLSVSGLGSCASSVISVYAGVSSGGTSIDIQSLLAAGTAFGSNAIFKNSTSLNVSGCYQV